MEACLCSNEPWNPLGLESGKFWEHRIDWIELSTPGSGQGNAFRAWMSPFGLLFCLLFLFPLSC